MSLLEKIIYIADYIEPNRCKAPNLKEVRRLAFQDINECMYHILRDTLGYLGKNPKTTDPATEEAYLFYSNMHNSK